MTITPEGKIKQAIKKVLDDMGCYHFMPVQTGMGKRTLDFLICYNGKFFGIEAKAPGNKITALQERCMNSIVKAGGQCTLIDSLEKVFHLRHWLEHHSND